MQNTDCCSNSSPLPDEEVMRMAFGYRDSLLAYSFSIMQDWSLAEDVVQEVYVSLHQKVGGLTFDDSPYHWLIKSTRLQSLYMRRSRQRETTTEDEDLLNLVSNLFEHHHTEQAAAHLSDRKKLLRGCIKKLPDRGLQVVVSFYHNSTTCEDIARELGQKAATIRQVLSRSRGQLRKCMAQKIEAQGI